jgi:aspartate/methionine/tyrosine aminotransferase
MKIASRMQEIAPFHVMELMARAQALEAQGRSIIHMEVGEPDFPTPQPIIDAAQAFIAEGRVFYTHALGLPALRRAIAGFYGARYGVAVDAERIIVTAGASAALLLALGVLINPGEELLLTDPGYPCNRNFVRLLEGRARTIAVGPESNYQPTAAQVYNHWNPLTRALLVASPSNPTGTMLDADRLSALHAVVSEHSGTLLVDEIYHGLTYGCTATTALAIADDIFVINSFSKYFNMTGWRLGWMVLPKAYVRSVEKLAQNLFISPSAPAQQAALAAFSPETIAILEARRAEFQTRRDLLLTGLQRLGFRIAAEPRGAFYVYADVRALSDDSFRFAGELLETVGVAATPGLDFGSNAPERHIRFAYTVAEEKLTEGLLRIKNFLDRSNRE